MVLIIHWKLCNRYGSPAAEKCCDLKGLEDNKVTIIWYCALQTEKVMDHWRLDIALMLEEK